MKNLMVGLVTAAAVVFGTGCGGEFCDDAADEYEALLSEKLEDCPDLRASVPPIDTSDEAISECRGDYETCSANEKEDLDEALGCIQDLPDCKADQQTAWALDLADCYNEASSVTCVDFF